MRIFKVYQFKSSKRQDLGELFQALVQSYSYQRILFELTRIDDSFGTKENDKPIDVLVKESRTISTNLFLAKFAYKDSFEYKEPGLRGALNASNLDANWLFPNQNSVTECPSIEEMYSLLKYLKKGQPLKCTSLIFGLDGIPWVRKPQPATHGFYKAFNQWSLRNPYGIFLSSSILVREAYKSIDICASIEVTPVVQGAAPFDETSCVSKLVELFGNPVGTQTVFAPSDDGERAIWDETALLCDKADRELDDALPEIEKSLPYELEDCPWAYFTEREKVDAKTIMRRVFKGSRWELRANPNREPFHTYHYRDKNGTEFDTRIYISDKGYLLQIQLYYSNKGFGYHRSGVLYRRLRNKEEVQHYFVNALDLLNKVSDRMTDAFSDILEKTGTAEYWHVCQ